MTRPITFYEQSKSQRLLMINFLENATKFKFLTFNLDHQIEINFQSSCSVTFPTLLTPQLHAKFKKN